MGAIAGREHRAAWKRPALAGTLVAVGGAVLAGWPPAAAEELSFRWSPLNMLAPLALLAIPIGGLAIGITADSRWFRYMCSVLLALASLGFLCAVPLAYIVADLNSHEALQRIAGDRYDVILYRTNCGATCSFGLILRQECAQAPGIVRQRLVHDWYPAYKAQVTLVGRDSLRVEVPPYSDERPSTADDRIFAVDPAPCGS